jgi:hypothetical protein
LQMYFFTTQYHNILIAFFSFIFDVIKIIQDRQP